MTKENEKLIDSLATKKNRLGELLCTGVPSFGPPRYYSTKVSEIGVFANPVPITDRVALLAGRIGLVKLVTKPG